MAASDDGTFMMNDDEVEMEAISASSSSYSTRGCKDSLRGGVGEINSVFAYVDVGEDYMRSPQETQGGSMDAGAPDL